MRVPKSIKTDAEFDTWLSFVQDRGNRAHGTTDGYDKHRCRCKRCRQAKASQYREKVRLDYANHGLTEWWR